MPDCPELKKILEQVGDEVTDREDAALRRHVEQCPVCQAQLGRLRWIPSIVREVARTSEFEGPHPTEMQLAVFAERGYAADDAGEIVQHLSQCRECREVVATAWRTALEQRAEDCSEPVEPTSLLRVIRELITPRRIVYAMSAFVAFAAECVLLAAAIAQFVMAWVIEPVGFQAVPSWWPLGLIPGGMIRFWVLITFCLVGAALLRWAAGYLFFRAMNRAESGAGKT